MKIRVERKWPKPTYTIGRFYIDGIFYCNTLEDADRGLKQTDHPDYIRARKVANETAIPKGTYKVILSVSPKFKDRTWGKKYGGLVPEILNVKGFSSIRIHPGTDASSTSGCPIVGDNLKVGKVLNSTKRYYELMDKLVPAWKSGDEITIEIV